MATTGDTLVVSKGDGRADLYQLDGTGVWMLVRSDLANAGSAYEIGRVKLDRASGRVWFRLDTEENDKIRHYQPN